MKLIIYLNQFSKVKKRLIKKINKIKLIIINYLSKLILAYDADAYIGE